MRHPCVCLSVLLLVTPVFSQTNTATAPQPSRTVNQATIQELEKKHIAGVLDNTKWNKNLSAKILDISLKTLYTKIQQYNLKEKE